MIDYEALILQFIGSLTLCDHMGDVSNNVVDILKKLDIDIDWDDWDDLGDKLGKMGVTTLNGTSLIEK